MAGSLAFNASSFRTTIGTKISLESRDEELPSAIGAFAIIIFAFHVSLKNHLAIDKLLYDRLTNYSTFDRSFFKRLVGTSRYSKGCLVA